MQHSRGREEGRWRGGTKTTVATGGGEGKRRRDGCMEAVFVTAPCDCSVGPLHLSQKLDLHYGSWCSIPICCPYLIFFFHRLLAPTHTWYLHLDPLKLLHMLETTGMPRCDAATNPEKEVGQRRATQANNIRRWWLMNFVRTVLGTDLNRTPTKLVWCHIILWTIILVYNFMWLKKTYWNISDTLYSILMFPNTHQLSNNASPFSLASLKH